MKQWFGIPRLQGDKTSILIGDGIGGTEELNLTLDEAEDLQWRIKQAIQLLKTGKIQHQHACK